MIVFLLCYATTAGWTQSHHPDLPFEHLNIPGTINSSQVSDIIQDHRGLIWISGNGLYRYDGYKFTSYRNVNDSLTIGGQEIHCILSDSISGRILLGTHSNGIVAHNVITGNFKRLVCEGGTPIITHLAQTQDGTIWGSSFSNGVFYVRNDTLKKFTNLKNRFYSNSAIMAFDNTLLVGGNRSIYRIQNKKLIDSIYIDLPGIVTSAVIRVTALTIDKTGKLWIGTEQSGVFVYDTLGKTFTKYFAPDTPPFHNRIDRILEANNKRVWILTKGDGLVVYSPNTDNFIHVVKNPLSERSLSGNNCTSIIQDRTGVIWVGATGDLNKYDPSKIKFRHIYANPFSPISLHDNVVRGIYEAPDKKLWVGTDGGVIHIFDEKKIKVEKIEIQLDGKKRVAPLYFLSYNNTHMLIASSEGLLQMDIHTKKIGYFKPLEPATKGEQVRQMIFYKDFLFYISVGRLFSYNLKTKQHKLYSQKAESPNMHNVTMLYADSSDRLWIGAKDGLFLYNALTDSFQQFAFEKNPYRPLGSYFMVLSIEEFDGKLWIGTFNDGLWTFDLKNLNNPVITHVSRKTEIQNATIYATLPDDSGNLWMSTNQGIIKYNPLKEKYTNFTVAEGLQQDEFNRLAYTLSANGEMIFGGINGLNIFNPKNVTIEEDDYTAYFLSFSALDEDLNTTFPIDITQGNTFSFKHNQNDVDISFFVPNYRNPKRYEVYYTLEGHSPNWVKAETNTLHYANLKPDTYTFHLKTVSISGKQKISTLTFTVLDPFWQTWWFMVLAAIVTCLIVATIIQASLHNSRRDKERLEALLRIRTQEIEKSREQLETLNQKKDLIFSILSHDLRSPLTTLKGFLSILIDDNQLSKEDVKRHASSIRNSVTSSLDLIDNTLFWSLSQTGNISYSPSVFSLNEMLNKIGNLYQLMIEKKKINFSIESRSLIFLYADENMTYVALRNIVSNALKFTPQGKAVKVTAYKKDNTGVIVIEDEGIGMSKSYLEKLFTEEQLPLIKGTHDEKGTGIGLILCRNFIQMNQGTLTATSVEGSGSVFTVELPLAQDRR